MELPNGPCGRLDLYWYPDGFGPGKQQWLISFNPGPPPAGGYDFVAVYNDNLANSDLVRVCYALTPAQAAFAGMQLAPDNMALVVADIRAKLRDAGLLP